MTIIGASRKFAGEFFDKGGNVFNVMHPDYGATGAGNSTLDTAGWLAAIVDASAAKGAIFAPPPPIGYYLIAQQVLNDANVPILGPSGVTSILRAAPGFVGTSILKFGSVASVTPQNVFIDGIGFDVNAVTYLGTKVDGLEIQRAQNIIIRNWLARGCRKGIYFNCVGTKRILTILLENGYTGGVGVGNDEGVSFVGTNPQNTSFDSFTFLNHSSESDATGIKAVGHLTAQNRIVVLGGSVQASTVAGIDADGFRVDVNGVYLETTSPSTIPALKGSNGAHFEISGATNIGYVPTLDASSSARANGTWIGGRDWRGTHFIGETDGARDGYLWGPPNFPSAGKAGFVSSAGQVYTDALGVKWTCTKGGASGTPPYPRWCALDGEIRIPVDFNTWINGQTWWWPQGDFELEEVEFQVTAAWTGGTNIGVYFGGNTQQGISQIQGAVANLVTGAVISSRRNKDVNASLAFPAAKFPFPASEAPTTPGTRVFSVKSGTFTTGTAVLVLRGKYITSGGVPTFGTPTVESDTDLLAIGGHRETHDGFAQATTVAISQTNVALTDALSPRGRIMRNAGSIVGIVAQLTNAKTAGTLTVTIQKSTDQGATWGATSATVTIANASKVGVATFAKDTSNDTFAQGDRLRPVVTTDGSYLPTANDLDVSIAVEA